MQLRPVRSKNLRPTVANVRQKDPALLVNKRGGRGRGLSVVRRGETFQPPPVPAGINAPGRRAWEAFWRSDVSLSVDLDADSTDLLHWVRCVDERERLWAIVKKAPLVKGSHGQLMANPLSRRIRDLTQDIDRISDRFGMNPMARFRLQFTVSEAGKSANELLRMLTETVDMPEVIDLDGEF